MARDFDAVVVGASIAGCTAATLLARRGLAVALVESRADPSAYKKVCTHFVQPSASPTIRRLGLEPALERAGAVRNRSDIWTPWGWVRHPATRHAATPEHGWSVRRQTLDPLLRTLALDTPGVVGLLGHSLTGLRRDGGRVSGVTVRTPDGGERAITARLVVGADGRNSKVAELAALRTRVRPNERFAYYTYWRGLDLGAEDPARFWFLDPDVAYAFPNEDGVVLTACMPTRARLAEFKQDVEGAFARTFAALPDGPRFDGAERVGPMLGMLEMPNVWRRPWAPGVALVGDAAMASDPLWGVGCGWAFESAAWLADAVGPRFTSDRAVDAGLRRYAWTHAARLGPHHLAIADYATGRRMNAMERLLLSAGARDERASEHVHEFAGRNIGPLRFASPAALARAAWVTRNGSRPASA